ncbi:serine hydrolase domain-containing protein [Rheinheimera faecalis]|uniref:serine hydrolase domain-containing protein n=1 Tax=Rheinheimera faecalis TaxID=2901141 RepID=UPI001E363692|nr:serine hydrolase domain-containing protein [Rheinheimera faecalis]
MRNWVLGLLLFLGSAAASAEQPQVAQAEFEQFLDELIQPRLDKGVLSNVSVALVYHNKLVVSRGYGFADQAAGQKLDPTQHLIRPGSVSKLLTWTAVMQLAEQGLIDLDTDINSYLDFTIPEHPSGPVTMRHLMTHRAGFEDVLRDLMATSPQQLVSNEEWLKRWVPQRVFAVGTVPAYSNYSAALAGYIVERVSKMPFATYVEQHIFQPAGMKNSSFRQPVPDALAGHIAKIYDKSGIRQVPYDYISPIPAGSLSATAQDMGLFMAAFLAEAKDGTTPLLNAKTREQMLSYSAFAAQGMDTMALGFFRDNEQGLQIWQHGGNTRTYHSHLMLVPEFGAGLFVSIGSAAGRAQAYELREALNTAFIKKYLPTKATETQLHSDPAGEKQRADEVIGYYQSSRTSFSTLLAVLQPLYRLKVTATETGDLILAGYNKADNTSWLWREVQPYLWQQVDGQDRLSAVVKPGQPVMLNIGALAAVQSWNKVHPLANAAVLLPAWCSALVILLLAVLKLPYLWFRYKKRWVHQTGAITAIAVACCALALFAGLALLNLALDGIYSFAPSDLLIRAAQLLCFFAVLGLVPAGLLLKQSFGAGVWRQRILHTLTVLAFLFIASYLAVYNLWSVQLYY